MISEVLTIGSFVLPTISFLLAFGFMLFLFLFWRAAKHEFVDEEFIFDTLAICLVSALFFARVFEFATHPAIYKWSFSNFIFLKPISGLSLWGALFGTVLTGFFYLKNKKYSFWQIFDLAAAPLFLFLAIYNLGLFLTSQVISLNFRLFLNLQNSFINTILFFILFWVLKRLEKQKRHVGFFVSFFIVFFSIVNLTVVYLGRIGILGGVDSADLFAFIPTQAVFSTTFLLFGSVSWYILAKRKVKEDTKGLLALFLLILFRAKRVLTSVREADQIARSIVLLPYNVAKFVLAIAHVLGKEIISSFSDLAHALGIKK